MNIQRFAAANLLAIAALALTTFAVTPAWAVPIHYEGAIPVPGTVTGSVGGNGWESETAADVDFWSFSGQAGNLLTAIGTRLTPGLDTVFTLYFGTTTADASQFIHDADWGGLRYIAIADDEISVPSGPGGDPALTGFLLPFTGQYTIAIGGIDSTGTGPFSYRLQVSQVSAVPEPEIALLFGAGLGLIGWVRRSRKGAARTA
jgi:hypothetical protein